jgi:hypothetical protein
MNNLFKKALLIGMIGLGTTTLKAQVITNANHAVNFRNYHSFDWLSPDIQVRNPLLNSELVTKNIEDNVNNELFAKGMKVDKQTPDLFFKFHTYTEKAVSNGYSSMYPMFGFGRFMPFGFGYGGYYGGGYSYNQGTLVIDAIDTRTKQLVWQGGISGSVNPRKIEKIIFKGVNKIMKKYPA